MLICRQVDDLAIGCADPDATHDLVATICNEDKIDLRDEGIVDSFNSVDVHQTDRYVKSTRQSCAKWMFLLEYPRHKCLRNMTQPRSTAASNTPPSKPLLVCLIVAFLAP